MPIALYTFGQFIKRADDPANQGFHDLNDPVFATVDKAPGLIARSGYTSDEGPNSWGEEVYPEFYTERGDGWSPATLSLWQDLESPFAFTYFGLHATALRHGRDWFEPPRWPPLTLWWHQGAGPPTWAEGVGRQKHLHEHGATASAFTFKQPYDAVGQATRLDKAQITQLRAAHPG